MSAFIDRVRILEGEVQEIKLQAKQEKAKRGAISRGTTLELFTKRWELMDLINIKY